MIPSICYTCPTGSNDSVKMLLLPLMTFSPFGQSFKNNMQFTDVQEVSRISKMRGLYKLLKLNI